MHKPKKDHVPFEKLQKQDINESISNEIVNYDRNDIMNAIGQATSNDDLLQHFLAADNVYADSEFCDDNVFWLKREWVYSAY